MFSDHFPFLKLQLLIVASIFSIGSRSSLAELVTFPVNGERYNALECRPPADGPLPAVVYNHGSIVDAVGFAEAKAAGNDLDQICQQLAKDGFVTLIPIRSERGYGKGFGDYKPEFRHIVNSAIDHIKSRSYVNPSKINLMGHSMGGLLTLLVGTQRNDLRALIISAPATKNKAFGSAVYDSKKINAPILLMIENSDQAHIQRGVDNLEGAFQTHKKVAKVIRYDRGGGHTLFFKVDYYWTDVREFLKVNN